MVGLVGCLFLKKVDPDQKTVVDRFENCRGRFGDLDNAATFPLVVEYFDSYAGL